MRYASLALVLLCLTAGLALGQPLPTDAERYAYAYAAVGDGRPYVLAVGVPPPSGDYIAPRLSFPSGFMGLKDGVYDCYRGAAGKPVMQLRAACPCGIGCACPAGVCPTGCPVRAAPDASAGQYVRVCGPTGCRLVWVPAPK